MISQGLITMSYVAAGVFFILSLGGLSHQETARRGNLFGIAGMIIALVATLIALETIRLEYLLPAIIVGASIGGFAASRVEMVQMPQMVALLHSFVGVAAVLVGFANYLDPSVQHTGVEHTIHEVEIYLGIFIGAITFTGSVVAFGKLQGVLASKPLMLPARHFINLAIVIASTILGYFFLSADAGVAWFAVLAMTALALLLGVFLVAAIGGADMPIVVSMLNSYSGWAAAVTGFMLNNDLLIITGALVGSSGAILSYIMCRAMNRSFISVILGGFGSTAGGAGSVEGDVKEILADETARLLKEASSVVIVPGYGMAVARAQNSISELVRQLREKSINVRFAIHPVAGRLPGHMNILLAEADVPYDIVMEMDEINPDLPDTDVVMVIGANDIVNPLAVEDPNSLIAGMPVIEVWKSTTVIIFKRSMAPGYAGIDNPLFFKDNSRMQFGDAEASVRAILQNM